MTFTYYMTQRPAGPGAQPRDGLIEVCELDQNVPIDGVGRAYSKIVYDRQLTDEEIRDYELTQECRVEDIEYKGYLLTYLPWMNLWAVRVIAERELGVVAYEDTLEDAERDIDEQEG